MKSDAVSVLSAPSRTRRAGLSLGFGFSKKPRGEMPELQVGWWRAQQRVTPKMQKLGLKFQTPPSPNLWGFDHYRAWSRE